MTEEEKMPAGLPYDCSDSRLLERGTGQKTW